jgi:5-formyltetrahydrofolate cyclo-ligase
VRKQEIRALFKQKRADLTAEERSTRSAQVCDLLKQRTLALSAKVVHLFLPISKFKELDLSRYVNWLWSAGIQVVVPVTSMESRTMVNVSYDSGGVIKISSLGIPEPEKRVVVPTEEIDLVIAPLLAVDQQLNRVGYGAGFYDELFADTRSNAVKIGVGYFSPMEKTIEDVRSEDVVLDAYCHPEGFLDISV